MLPATRKEGFVIANPDKKQLSQLICERLLEAIRTGEYANEDKLPPEEVLAMELGVSRTLLRDCLAALEREGFITRLHGVGTIINKHVLKVKTRMDMEMEFLDMIAAAGAVPGIAFTETEKEFCGERLAEKLAVAPGTPVLRVTRMVTADGKPAIYCIDHISFLIIKDHSYRQEDLDKPIFHFLQKFCHTDVYLDLTVVEPLLAGPNMARLFGIKESAPLLHMDEIGYDMMGKPVLWSDEYYVGDAMKHTVMRKKI